VKQQHKNSQRKKNEMALLIHLPFSRSFTDVCWRNREETCNIYRWSKEPKYHTCS